MKSFREIINANNPAAALVTHLRETSGELLTNIISYMDGRVRNLRVDSQSHSLKFEIASQDDPSIYEIRKPINLNINDHKLTSIFKIYPDIAKFYQSNNGLFYSLDRSLGPAPIEDWFFLAEEEWGILEDIPKPNLDLEKVIALFSNGMGSYVCINTDEPSPKRSGILWSSKSPPKIGLDPLAVIDEWTKIGMER